MLSWTGAKIRSQETEDRNQKSEFITVSNQLSAAGPVRGPEP